MLWFGHSCKLNMERRVILSLSNTIEILDFNFRGSDIEAPYFFSVSFETLHNENLIKLQFFYEYGYLCFESESMLRPMKQLVTSDTSSVFVVY